MAVRATILGAGAVAATDPAVAEGEATSVPAVAVAAGISEAAVAAAVGVLRSAAADAALELQLRAETCRTSCVILR